MRFARHILLLLALARALHGEDSLAHARAAQRLLGPEFWSRVIRIDNAAARSRYPRTVYALVFALDGVLWFYTDTDGTQSLSQYRGRLQADKDELGPLLRAIDPGFAAWTLVPDGQPGAAAPRRIPNGCFIESVAILRRLLLTGRPATMARLLVYYIPVAGGVHGHTVLEFAGADGEEVIDPEWPARAERLKGGGFPSALTVAARLRANVVRALWIPLAEVRGNDCPHLASDPAQAGAPARA